MKKSGIAITLLALGAVGGTFYYSKKHPLKMKMAMNKMKSMIKDYI